MIQRKINIYQTKQGLYSQFNSVPLLGMEFISIFSTGLLIVAVNKLRNLCKTFSSLSESKLVVRTTLTLFSLANICLIFVLIFQLLYAKLEEVKFYNVAIVFHLLALIVLSTLLTFLAFVVIKLS